MAEEPRSYPLIMELVRRSRLPWRWVLTTVAAVLVLLLVLAALADGDSADLATWRFWRDFLDGPALAFYILAMYPVLWRRWWTSVQSVRSLLLPDGGLNGAVAGVSMPDRRWEWIAIIVGAAVWPSLWRPWERNWIPGELWVNAYDVGTQTTLFGLIGLMVYTVLAGSRDVCRLSRLRLNVGVFDTEPLMPIARSSLGYSLAFIGGISLSLVFQTQEDLLKWNNIVVWVAVVCLAVLLFFLSVWSTHTAMARLKGRELHMVQQRLKAVSTRLNQPASGSGLDGMGEFSSTMMAWLTYERRIKEAPEWPFNSGIIRKLMVSTLAPVAVFLVKVLSRLDTRIWPGW